jgi:glucuronoarabinoxylan endo-1,4-beta-xylanase
MLTKAMAFRAQTAKIRRARSAPIFRCECVAVWLFILGSTLPKRVAAADAVVRPTRVDQRITGFGASSAWTAPSLSDADADLLFSTDSGIGLSLLRVRIAPDGSCAEVSTAQQAQARGAQVWATPWSPPAAWKSNDNVNEGGTLLPEHADDWANSLVGFVSMMQAQGVTITGLSAQNEPTMMVSYESCEYTAPALADFTANHLRPALDAAGSSVPIVAPETVGWTDLPTFSSAILTDPNAAAAVGIFATHAYNGAPFDSADITEAGKELWQTEVYDKGPVDAGIGSALFVALSINAALVRGNVSAWHYWWIKPDGASLPDNSALWDQVSGLPAKRLYALGNFSRFVRPGFYRVEVPLSPTPGLSLSAFTDPSSKALVVVAVNQTGSTLSQRFLFDGVSTGSWQTWVTSADSNLTAGAAIADGASVSYAFAPESVTTLQGLITGVGPAIPDDGAGASDSSDTSSCAFSAHVGSVTGAAWSVFVGLGVLSIAGARRRRRWLSARHSSRSEQ